MIYGIGVDIVNILRFKNLVSDSAFMNKIFSEDEKELIGENPVKAADNFAAKEAVVKSLGSGFVGVSPKDIKILREKSGKPYIIFDKYKNIFKFHLSISNTNEQSIAFVIAERHENEIISDI